MKVFKRFRIFTQFGLIASCLFSALSFAQNQSTVPLTPNQIKVLQQELKSLGYPVGPIDGVIGQQTSKAIGEFQKNNGQKATGKFDTKTIASLDHKSLPQGIHEEAGTAAKDHPAEKDKNLDPELFDNRFTGSNTQGDTGTGSGV